MIMALTHISKRALGLLSCALILLGVWQSGMVTSYFHPVDPDARQRLYDQVGIFQPYDVKGLEEHLFAMYIESDIDMRILFVNDTEAQPLEDFAQQKMHELRIGATNREERGLLLVFDTLGRRLRIEVGYGLEGYFPDAFISYVIRDHAQAFFSSSNYALGLELLLRIFHHRIREAVLGKDFDPTVIEVLEHRRYLSSGAGAAANVSAQQGKDSFYRGTLTETQRKRFGPQPTPEEAHQAYLQWLANDVFDAQVDLFTKESQNKIGQLPMTKAFFHEIMLEEYGKRYASDIRGNLALLYCIDSPFPSPHFFVKGEEGWQMDVVTEIRNTQNVIGGVYTWQWRGQNDAFTRTFFDRLIMVNGAIRINEGDNRPLITRRSSASKRI